MEEIRLSARDLTVGYGHRSVVSDMDFSVAAGRVLTLIGPNGAGKSTVLKTLVRQLDRLAGVICLDGRPSDQITDSEAARKMAIVMTRPVDTTLMTCEDIAATGRYPYTGRLGILSKEDREKVREVMALMALEDLRDVPFDQISDGQRQRVMLARALCQEPEILVLDEPTTFLDIRYKTEFLQLLRDFAAEKGMAVILSLHELDLAQKISDTVMCIRDGRVDRLGTPEQVFESAYICSLYGLENARFMAHDGSIEMPAVTGESRTVVIGGGGMGIGLYRQLQRRRIPFAAVLPSESDLEYPAARALAVKVVCAPPFEAFSDKQYEEAKVLVDASDLVYCPVTLFGTGNLLCRDLKDYAASLNKLANADCI